MTELNQNRKVRMLIKYGLSDEITVQDNKGQGNVLSGPEFTSLADEIAVELRPAGMGVLLFMDGITFASEEFSKAENMEKNFQKTM